jgi:hypothetical protein
MTKSPSIVSILLLLVSLSTSTLAAGSEWRRPFEPEDLVSPTEPVPLGFDPCGCLGGLRGCLIAAAVNLDGCLRDAPSGAQETLCYLKFELDVLLCLERAGTCQLSCVP